MNTRLMKVAVVLVAIACATVAVSGCSSTASDKSKSAVVPMGAKTKPSTPATDAAVATASDIQTCLECGKKQMPKMVKGSPIVENGMQVVAIAIKGGTYEPNRITAKAGMPITLVFSGKAKGCLAKPTFKSLGKSMDLTGTSGGSLDLGTLKPGVYEFTCGMGMNKSTITVQ